MSLNAERKFFKHEMPAGVHLAVISDIKTYLDANKNTIVKEGEIAVIVSFTNGQNQHHEQMYWIGKGMEGKERHFTKMCQDALVDLTVTPLPKKKIVGKRLWIAIKEVFTLVGDGTEIKKDITGKEVIEYFIFNTAVVDDPDKAPKWPDQDFISYKLEGQSGYDSFIPGQKIENAVVVEEYKGEDQYTAQDVSDVTGLPKEVFVKQSEGDIVPSSELEIEKKAPLKPSTIMPNFGDSPDDTFNNG